jgi:glycosyltransferase involved in cell wall biosynthesis
MKIFVMGTRGFPDIQGGVEQHCENLYPLLASKKCLITVFRRKPYIVKSDKTCNCIRFIDLFSTRIPGFEAFVHSFLSAIRCLSMKRPDIVHIHNIGPGFFMPLLKLFGLKVVLTYHSPNYEHTKWSFPAKYFLRTCETISLWCADKIIFVSEHQMGKFPNFKQKTICIPNGIKNPKLLYQKKTSYLEKINIQAKDYILFVGRLTPEKGVDVLLEAFKKTKTNKKLVIAGAADNNGTYVGKLNTIAENSSQIVFTGFVTGNDLSCLYENAHAFVLPSYNEGNPIVMLEAMSYGLPIIASDIPANKEIKLPSESYFTTGNVQALVKKLDDVIHKEVNVEHYDMNRYNWENIAQQTLEIFNGILAENKKTFWKWKPERHINMEKTFEHSLKKKPKAIEL